MDAERITVVFATIDRPQCASRLVNSIGNFFPDMKILIGEQVHSECGSALNGINAEVIKLPYDFGVSATRNALVSKVSTEFFALCDDDHIFGRQTSFNSALTILDSNPTIGIVGGLVFNVFGDNDLETGTPGSWEKTLIYDRDSQTLVLVPIWNPMPTPFYAKNWQYFLSDTVENFAVMRTKWFHNGVLGWDPQFSCIGEHEDFYLNRKVNAPHIKVAYSPAMQAYHNHHSADYGNSYSNLRWRLAGWRRFYEKWGIHTIFDVGEWVGGVYETNSPKVYPAIRNHNEFFNKIDELEGRNTLDGSKIGIDKFGRLYYNVFNAGVVQNVKNEQTLLIRPGSNCLHIASSRPKVVESCELRTSEEHAVTERAIAPHQEGRASFNIKLRALFRGRKLIKAQNNTVLRDRLTLTDRIYVVCRYPFNSMKRKIYRSALRERLRTVDAS
jgi:GT2 family glycosyltransferase